MLRCSIDIKKANKINLKNDNFKKLTLILILYIKFKVTFIRNINENNN